MIPGANYNSGSISGGIVCGNTGSTIVERFGNRAESRILTVKARNRIWGIVHTVAEKWKLVFVHLHKVSTRFVYLQQPLLGKQLQLDKSEGVINRGDSVDVEILPKAIHRRDKGNEIELAIAIVCIIIIITIVSDTISRGSCVVVIVIVIIIDIIVIIYINIGWRQYISLDPGESCFEQSQLSLEYLFAKYV